jgi:hypothetical protein
MSHHSETPFDNIESSHEYVRLLADAIALALSEVEADIALAGADRAERGKEALQLVAFKLNKLSSHMTASRRILNDLRSLRRLLLEERSLASINGGAIIGDEAPREQRLEAVVK